MSLGWTEDQTRWQVASGRWQRPFRGVYLTFSGPVPPAYLAEAAIRYAGAGSALSHSSAGAFYRFAKPPVAIHLAVMGDRKVAKQPGLVIHRSRSLSAGDIVAAHRGRRRSAPFSTCSMSSGRLKRLWR
jgi:hypothetical protein